MPRRLLAYKVNTLTAAIETAPYIPGRLGSMGLFESRGVARTHVDLEYMENKLHLLTTSERGARQAQVVTGPKRKILTFRIPHIAEQSVIRSDDLPDVRAFGTDNGSVSVQALVADLLRDHRQNIEATWEFYRMGAVNGKLVEPDGTTIYDFFTEFGISEPEISIDLTSTSDTVKLGAAELTRHIQNRLGTKPYSRIHILCGDDFFDALITKEEVKRAYDRPRSGAFLRENQVRDAFEYAGVIWENYRGSVGTVDFLPAASARAVPVGVPGLFIQRNGPDDTMAGVGGMGKPITVTREALPHDSGVEFKSQSNPLFLCTLPSTLVKITNEVTSS